MDTTSQIHLLDRLLTEPDETEWLEFKQNRYEPQDLGQYLSALSNSACVHRKSKGYLVFGIRDKTHEVVGTDFDPRREKKGNQDLVLWLASLLQPNVGFEVHGLCYQGKQVVLFEVNAATDIPVAFRGTQYIRIGSSKTELRKHPEKAREIWMRREHEDWSAQTCDRASVDDLDPQAIRKARQEYRKKQPDKADEIDDWDAIRFLNKARISIQGRITNTAILLLGKPESAALLSPAVAQMTWFLRDERNQPKEYEHFGPPFLLNVDRLFARVRNLTFRHLPYGTLFPMETTQYDSWVIREALHNCIAHQDYELHGRINVVEKTDSLSFTNVGSFIPGNVETVIRQDIPPEVYRNPFLCAAMVNLNMIDTQGGGIRRMFETQMQRFFPLPDYDLSKPDRVAVRIRGEVLDEKYTRVLMRRTDLDLWTVIVLDKVQKRIAISKEEHKRLKRLEVVEGRYPNLLVSSEVATATGEKARHVRDRGFNKEYYQDLILKLIRETGPATRADIDALLMNKLPEVLTDKQKRNRIHNLLGELGRKRGLIRNIGSRNKPRWVICRKESSAKNQ
jgi:ATP-dependent DNA helicase RecG